MGLSKTVVLFVIISCFLPFASGEVSSFSDDDGEVKEKGLDIEKVFWNMEDGNLAVSIRCRDDIVTEAWAYYYLYLEKDLQVPYLLFHNGNASYFNGTYSSVNHTIVGDTLTWELTLSNDTSLEKGSVYARTLDSRSGRFDLAGDQGKEEEHLDFVEEAFFLGRTICLAMCGIIGATWLLSFIFLMIDTARTGNMSQRNWLLLAVFTGPLAVILYLRMKKTMNK